MTKEITVEMLDQTIQWCKQNAFWGKPSAVPRVLDFYFEKTRTTVDEDWPESFTLEELAQALGIEQVRYRIYYSQDNLTLRLFVLRPRCTWDEQKIMLDLGFVIAQDNDSNTIPNQPVEAVEQ
jgi:hypothetical protein